jgi:hypothetical protein
VIVLRRYLPEVLKSLIELGHFSPQNRNWASWMSLPSAMTAAFPGIDAVQNLDQYDLAISYLIDIEARALRFQAQYPEVKLHNVRLEDLNHPDKIYQLFAQLRITPTTYTASLCNRRVNHKSRAKRSLSNTVDLDNCRDRIERYLKRAQALGLVIPPTLALEKYVGVFPVA